MDQRFIGRTTVLFALSMLFLSVFVNAQQTPPPPKVKVEPAKPISASDGPEMFRSYCSPCLGRRG
jgi:hypothetical protein